MCGLYGCGDFYGSILFYIFMKEQILKELKTEWAGHTCHYFETLNSTNDHAKSLLKEGACHGTLVVADCQTGGKGRRGRVWETP